MNRGRSFLLILALSCTTAMAHTQQSASQAQAAPPRLPGLLETHTNLPTAAPGDVDTVDHLVHSIYDVISGPAGKPRDWNRFLSLFLPEGRLGPIRGGTSATGEPQQEDVVFITPDGFVDRDDPYFKANGFFERPIANRIEEFGNLVQVWSSYESRHTADDSKPFARGINSMQIVHARGRFWIASIMWDAERPGLTLPDKYVTP